LDQFSSAGDYIINKFSPGTSWAHAVIGQNVDDVQLCNTVSDKSYTKCIT